MSIKQFNPPVAPNFDRQIPPDDTMERDVCTHCGFVAYENPKIVVGAVVRQGQKLLLCKRAIAPRVGYWTLPAGYLELNETPIDGAKREAREEANASIDIFSLLAVYSIPRISQVQLIYRGRLEGGFSAGVESQDVALFDWQNVPWRELAFPSVHWALTHDRMAAQQSNSTPFSNPAGEFGDRMPPEDGL